MIISIVTINFNNSKGLETTLKSIKSQTYGSIELVVVDGKSSDNSFNIINHYDGIISKKIIESDNGIYFAMNKGISQCTGDFLIFLNSGDFFYDSDSLNKMISKIDDKKYGYFGKALIIDQKKNISFKSPLKIVDKYQINYNFTPNHQAVLFPRNFYLNNNYNTNYSICSDADYIFRLAQSKQIRFLDIDFVCFELGGVSSSFKSLKKTLIQIYESISINYKYQNNKLKAITYIPLKFIIKYILDKVLGENYFKFIRKINVIRQKQFN